jgi:hypothetical protein
MTIHVLFYKMKLLLKRFIFNFCFIVFSSVSWMTKTQNFQNLMDMNGFKCVGVTGIDTPIRLSPTGDVECFSLNGNDCIDELNNDMECKKYVILNKSKLVPLLCGPHLKSLTGSTGYEEEGHWCKKGHDYFYKKWHCPSETGTEMITRINKEQFAVECFKNSQGECMKGQEAIDRCGTIINGKENTNPLVCKKDDFWQTDTNFCKIAHGYFRYTGEYLCSEKTGVDTPLRLSPDGEVQCMSRNARDCLWGNGSGQNCIIAINYQANINQPLSCGRHHQQVHGSGGYGPGNSWCGKPFPSFYEKQNSIAYGPYNKHMSELVKNIFDEILPDWFINLVGEIEKGKYKTPAGAIKLQKLLERKGMDPHSKEMEDLKEKVSSGTVTNDNEKKELLKIIISRIFKKDFQLQ